MLRLRHLLSGPLVLLVAAGVTAGEPYVPSDESEVLETLPTDVFASRDGITKLRRRLSAEPDNQELAATVAQHYQGLGKSEGDPRFFGYARAAISSWWGETEVVAPLLRVRAKLKETNHDYRGALADLKLLLHEEPTDVQAWVEVANIHRVLGEYDAAWEACENLGGPSDSLPAMIARVPLMAATGRAEEAYQMLSDSRDRLAESLPGVIPWAETMQAEIARSLGREEDAERHYRAGIEAGTAGAYHLRAYADFLLDQDRSAEALELLRDDLRDNGALLRSAIAAKMSGRVALAEEQSEQLKDRFAETRLRGDLPHGRFEARYELEFGGDPRHSLRLALENWERQKETRDTRNVLEAAVAAEDSAAAQPVIAFLAEHGVEDVALARLVKRLEEE